MHVNLKRLVSALTWLISVSTLVDEQAQRIGGNLLQDTVVQKNAHIWIILKKWLVPKWAHKVSLPLWIYSILLETSRSLQNMSINYTLNHDTSLVGVNISIAYKQSILLIDKCYIYISTSWIYEAFDQKKL